MRKMRNGSALLIVLGMLSFMVVSAVAFAAYMRSARLPSSYLRRTVSSRLLVKAALAEAMERIDFAIADNPYPGVGDKVCTSSARTIALDETAGTKRNYFYHNIFVGTNGWMDAADTVSTLTLEGLAYIPPPFVNDARRLSRLSPAATWHTMFFDSGRYAYSAIDVSDCFDINRLKANTRRNSGGNRISLAYLFEDSNHTSYSIQPSQWDSFMDNFLKPNRTEADLAADPGMVDKGKMPLVSVADLNLALGTGGAMESPFCKYIVNNGANFYGISSNIGAEANKFRSMAFVTDSYFPSIDQTTVSANGELELATGGAQGGQPFLDYSPGRGMTAFMAAGGTAGKTELLKWISYVDIVCLYDYLDADNVPVSLALPTTERVPMICGITPTLPINITTRFEQGEKKQDPTTKRWTVESKYYLNDPGFAGGLLKTTVLFPFKHGGQQDESFTLDGCVRLFFTEDGNKSFRNWTGLHPSSDGDFSQTKLQNRGIFAISAGQTALPSFSGITSAEGAIQDVNLQLQAASSLSVFNEPVFWVKEEMEDSNGQPDPSTAKILSAHCNICPVKADGSVDPNYSDDAKFLNLIKAGGGEFSLKMVVYLRVKCNGKTVDMVPATCADDALNGADNTMWVQVYDGADAAALRFDTDCLLKWTRDDFKSNSAGGQKKLTQTAIACPDPRYNFAPENWMQVSDATKSAWKTMVDGVLGQGGRDRDIWMSVSNQEQLQSVYELAMLPRVCNAMDGTRDSVHGNLPVSSDGRTDYATSIAGLVHGGKMWTTYRCFANNGGARDQFENIAIVTGGGAVKVNPYSSSLVSIMGAFANTPCDWAVACTNESAASALTESSLAATTFNRDYAFSAMSTKTKFSWEDLEEIALNFRDAAQEQALAGKTWEDAWDSLGWVDNSSDRKFCGVDLTDTVDLSDVDRKFLYGFWRDSFANRQQLFLIFVRAEPAMMGGGAVGQTPPQLGARAVALVWRDPETATPGNPHRMRVLFYRQLD